jgi:hypothetical protein
MKNSVIRTVVDKCFFSITCEGVSRRCDTDINTQFSNNLNTQDKFSYFLMGTFSIIFSSFFIRKFFEKIIKNCSVAVNHSERTWKFLSHRR